MVGRDVTEGGEGKGCKGEAFAYPRFNTSNNNTSVYY